MSEKNQKFTESSELIVKKQKCFEKFQFFIINFLYESSVHGLIYLVRFGLHILERLLWCSFIILAIYGTYSISERTWNRYQTSPVVISMDRNMFFWNTSFPSLTVCPHTKVDALRIENYFREHPEKFQNEQDKLDFTDFITKLANVTYENIDTHEITRTFDIESIDYMDLIYNLSWPFDPEISSGTSMKLRTQETVTELGVCYSVNSKVAIYNSYPYWKSNSWREIKGNDTVVVHPLDGEIYAQMINLSTTYEVYFHGALEVPEISRQRYTFFITDYSTVELQALETKTSSDVADLKVTQRKCRFPDENETIQRSPLYTYNQCLMECRIKYSMKKCGCIPHFYRRSDRKGVFLPVCDIQTGFKCLASIKQAIIGLKSNDKEIDCHCEKNCDASVFYVQAFRSRIWFLGANLQWGINDYPKMQLRRELLFAFTDVLVYIGGTAGLFLGSSLLSVTEFVYFLSWRLIKTFWDRKNNVIRKM